MSQTPTSDTFPRVRATVAACLEMDLDEIAAESTLLGDLGIDSLDFVDLLFLLEEEFGVQLQGGELDLLTRLSTNAPDIVQDGHLTPGVLDRIRPWLPALAEQPDPERITAEALFGLIAVGDIDRAIGRAIAGRGD